MIIPGVFRRSTLMNSAYRRFGLVSILIIALIAATTSSGASSGAQKRLITESDLFKFAWIADPQISPDGSRVAFVRVWVNQKADRYDSALWIVATSGGAARQLTAGPRDSSPRRSEERRVGKECRWRWAACQLSK